ncbi:MAG: IS21-like element helper ATPase IstB [Burkholderiaceae bacterium]
MNPDIAPPPETTTVAPQVLLVNHFIALKLPTFARYYEKVGADCAREGVDYPRYLLRLCELERIDRERRTMERRIRLARFPVTKILDTTFDFMAMPAMNKSLVLELARCEWIAQHENVIALGPSGVGKTHTALALELADCQKGYSVAFTTAAALMHELMEARDEKRLRTLQKQLTNVRLLIVDELGYVLFTAMGAELLFEVFSRRYEQGATLVTSNLTFDEWTSVLGSERLTGALLDRLTHHVHILKMNGESYRLATSKKRQQRHAKPAITAEKGEANP